MGAGGQDGLGLGQVCQTFLPPGHFRRPVQLGRQGFALVGLLAQRQQFRHFLAQAFFHLEQALPTHGVALGSIGVDLGAVQAEVAQLQHPGGFGQEQDLDEHLLEFDQEALTEVGQRVVVGVETTRQEAKRDRLVGGAFDLAGTEHARGVGVEQQAQ